MSAYSSIQNKGTTVKVAPSLLSANMLDIGRDVARVRDGGVDLLHLDIMDGYFVPNLTFGPDIAKDLRTMGLPLDVHLMVSNPDSALRWFCEYADYVTIHVEATAHLHRLLKEIRDRGCRSGVALNPSTPPDFLPYVIDQVDLVLVMTVNPGLGGQSFIPAMLPKIQEIRRLVDEAGLPVEIQVDGGITADNSRLVVEKGADILVSGSYVFSSDDVSGAIRNLKTPGPSER